MHCIVTKILTTGQIVFLSICCLFLSLQITVGQVVPVDGSALYNSTFKTSTGHELLLRQPQKMTCDAMSATLSNIDETGYRAHSADSVSDHDTPLFYYETELSQLYYERCGVLPMGRPNKGTGTFQHIFDENQKKTMQ